MVQNQPHHRRHRYYERFTASSFVDDKFESDVTAGEDPVVRQAALDALGNMNGTVLAIEPTSGRVLAMVNQKLALSSGAQPCSTIKSQSRWPRLSEDLITKDTQIALGRRSRMNLTTALAHSNNAYFEALGRQLGIRKSQLLRSPVRTGRTRRIQHLRASNWASIRSRRFRPNSAA